MIVHVMESAESLPFWSFYFLHLELRPKQRSLGMAYLCVRVCLCVCLSMCLWVCVCLSLCTSVCVRVFLDVCVSFCVCVFVSVGAGVSVPECEMDLGPSV